MPNYPSYTPIPTGDAPPQHPVQPPQTQTTPIAPPRESDQTLAQLARLAGDLQQELHDRNGSTPSDRPRRKLSLRFVSVWLSRLSLDQLNNDRGRDLKRNYVLLFCGYMGVGLLCSKVGLGGQMVTRPIAVFLHNAVFAMPVAACEFSVLALLFIKIQPRPRMERRLLLAAIVYLFAHSLYTDWLGGLPK